ncbi:hypothetical protein BDV96DRAFT_648611 [Lophiotrema nucula]|uniref:Uncharacterized protein n=1 Tax=Lophiotrema nucula TaxID=690887 RepID=A0A6A5Z3J5_9PLEO|nr:hypothetical protein BDV96DRAFT_648611 [Lophiotrema nucula]
MSTTNWSFRLLSNPESNGEEATPHGDTSIEQELGAVSPVSPVPDADNSSPSQYMIRAPEVLSTVSQDESSGDNFAEQWGLPDISHQYEDCVPTYAVEDPRYADFCLLLIDILAFNYGVDYNELRCALDLPRLNGGEYRCIFTQDERIHHFEYSITINDVLKKTLENGVDSLEAWSWFSERGRKGLYYKVIEPAETRFGISGAYALDLFTTFAQRGWCPKQPLLKRSWYGYSTSQETSNADLAVIEKLKLNVKTKALLRTAILRRGGIFDGDLDGDFGEIAPPAVKWICRPGFLELRDACLVEDTSWRGPELPGDVWAAEQLRESLRWF